MYASYILEGVKNEDEYVSLVDRIEEYTDEVENAELVSHDVYLYLYTEPSEDMTTFLKTLGHRVLVQSITYIEA